MIPPIGGKGNGFQPFAPKVVGQISRMSQFQGGKLKQKKAQDIGAAHDLTPGIIGDTSAPGAIIGRISLRPNTWTSYDVDRPTILYDWQAVDRGASGGVLATTIFYNYGEVPQTVPGTSQFMCNTSSKGGMCFLSSPGLWWMRTNAGQALDLLVIDAWHPGVAAKYYTEPGCNNVFQKRTSVPDASGTVQLWVSNRFRIAGTAQLISGGPVLLALGQVTNYLFDLGSPTGKGLLLTGNGSSITFTGDTFGTGQLLAIMQVAGAAALVETVEYLNA